MDVEIPAAGPIFALDFSMDILDLDAGLTLPKDVLLLSTDVLLLFIAALLTVSSGVVTKIGLLITSHQPCDLELPALLAASGDSDTSCTCCVGGRPGCFGRAFVLDNRAGICGPASRLIGLATTLASKSPMATSNEPVKACTSGRAAAASSTSTSTSDSSDSDSGQKYARSLVSEKCVSALSFLLTLPGIEYSVKSVYALVVVPSEVVVVPVL